MKTRCLGGLLASIAAPLASEQQGGNGTDGAPISALYNLAGQRLSPTRQPAPGCYVVKTPSGSARTVYYRAR